MKPHEETWAVKNLGPGLGPTVEFPTRNGAVSSGLICGGVPSVEDRVAVMRLIAAAPEMARALLMCGCWSQNGALKQWHTHLCWRHQSFAPFNTPDNCTEDCRAALAALAKAGVLR